MNNFEEQLNEFGKKMKEFFESEQMRQLQRYGEIISNLQKLGNDYNWVVVSTDVNTDIADNSETEINDYFISLICNDDNFYKKIKDTFFECCYLKDKFTLMKEIFDAIENGNVGIACIALSTILECLLAIESDYNSIRINVLLENFMDNVGDIDIKEYEVGFLFSLDGFLKNYSLPTDGFSKDKEPKYVNRHWIAHGRMYRDLTNVDTYQILLAVYALIRIMVMEKRVKSLREND